MITSSIFRIIFTTCVRFRVVPRFSGTLAASTRLVSVRDGAGPSQFRLRTTSRTLMNAPCECA